MEAMKRMSKISRVRKSIGLACVVAGGFLLAPGAWAVDLDKAVEFCTGCHGKDGISTDPEIPIIAGNSIEYMVSAMTDFKKKERPCTPTAIRTGDKKGTKTDMCQNLKDLSDADIKQVAQYFVGKKFVSAKQKFDATLAKQGNVIFSKECAKCHAGDNGQPSDDVGRLAGQWTPYLRAQYKDFVAGKRIVPKKMKPKIEAISKEDYEAMLNYWASLQ